MPKSAILALPAVLSRMLAGFMSRCTCSTGLCLLYSTIFYIFNMVGQEEAQGGGCHTQSTRRWEMLTVCLDLWRYTKPWSTCAVIADSARSGTLPTCNHET